MSNQSKEQYKGSNEGTSNVSLSRNLFRLLLPVKNANGKITVKADVLNEYLPHRQPYLVIASKLFWPSEDRTTHLWERKYEL